MYVASTFRRVIAHLADELVGAIFWIPLVVKALVQLKYHQVLILPWSLVGICWLSRMAYEMICIYSLQSLPAQYFLGLKIVSTHHPELGLSLAQVALRVLFAQFKYILGPSIYFMALFHRERQHLGDILAETRVMQVQERLFVPKVRFILGSFLVYSSLLGSLNESVTMVVEKRLTGKGIRFETPEIEIGSVPGISI